MHHQGATTHTEEMIQGLYLFFLQNPKHLILFSRTRNWAGLKCSNSGALTFQNFLGPGHLVIFCTETSSTQGVNFTTK
jgi:hypothetical protein